jgi:hypothetical protein
LGISSTALGMSSGCAQASHFEFMAPAETCTR